MKNYAILALFSGVLAPAAFGLDLSVMDAQFKGVRVYSNQSEIAYGYAVKSDSNIGGFFELKSGGDLLFSGSKYGFSQGLFYEKNNDELESFKKYVLPYFSERYGLKFYSGKSTGAVYVFLDYGCKFSSKFVESKRLDELKKKGKDIWIFPISKDAKSENILNYGHLICSKDQQSKKVNRMLSWLAGERPVRVGNVDISTCHYWLDLKPYYGIIDQLKLGGVPAIIEV